MKNRAAATDTTKATKSRDTRKWSDLLAAVKLLWKIEASLLIGSAVVMICAGLVPTFAARVSSKLIGELAGGQHWQQYTPLIIWIGVLALAGMLLARAGVFTQEIMQRSLANHVAVTLARKLSDIEVEHYENPQFHNELRIATSEGATRPIIIVQNLMQAIGALVTMLAAGWPLVIWKIWLLPIVLVGPALSLRQSLKDSSGKLALTEKSTELERETNLIQGILTSDKIAKDIRLLGISVYLTDQLEKKLRELTGRYTQYATRRLRAQTLLSSVIAGDRPLILAYCAFALSTKSISFTEFVYYYQLIALLQNGLGTLGTSIGRVAEGVSYFGKYHKLLEMPDCREEHTNVDSEGIQVRNITFRYPNAEHPTLRDVSFEIPHGRLVAVVGRNGSGKTTLVKVLAGLYEAEAGQVFIGGEDILRGGYKAARRHAAFLFQDYLIFNTSIRENVEMGAIDSPDRSMIAERVATEFGLPELVPDSRLGIDAVIGKMFTGGIDLSGGQKKLIAVARLAASQRRFLILDEPTAALDEARRNKVREFLVRRQKEGCGIVYVTHDADLAELAECVLFVEDGTIRDVGSHLELQRRCRAYSRIFPKLGPIPALANSGHVSAPA